MASSESRLVAEVLEDYGARVRRALTSYLRSALPRGSLYDLAADYPGRGGRYMRASLCMAAAAAFGAHPEQALRSAVSLELLHNAFLVHDDVEDESEERRGAPTLHRLHGIPVAINVGDTLAVLGLQPLMENRTELGTHLTMRILEETSRMARESVEGQATELAWRRDNVTELGEADYLRMILQKTCWYTTIYPCRVGALIGSGGRAPLDGHVRYGFFLGAAFQIQDDLLNLVGDQQRYGKELSGDLWEAKRTLMLIRLLNVAAPEERLELRRILGLERAARSTRDVAFVRDGMDKHGALLHAAQIAHALAGAARHEFQSSFADLPDSRDKRFLAALPLWVLERA